MVGDKETCPRTGETWVGRQGRS